MSESNVLPDQEPSDQPITPPQEVKEVKEAPEPVSEPELRPDDYKFKSQLQLRTAEEDLLVMTDIHKREMEFSQHEFVKMNEVG